jgi:hypothetical protein
MVGDIEAMNAQLSSRRPALLAFALACGVLSTETLAIAQGGFFGIGGGVSYRPFKDPVGRFQFDLPTKDWNELPHGGSTLVILARNDRTATVVIDLTRLTEPLDPSEVATNAQIELDLLKEQQPQAKNFASEILETKAGVRGSLIRYARLGTSGPERVMRFSAAIGLNLFRLDAVVPEQSLEKHEPIIMRMIQSFKSPADPPGAKK